MKISLNAIKQFTEVNIGVDELVEKIGAQLGAVEETIDFGTKYKGVLVAKVVECRKHENSDHLNVCKIDDGGVAQNVERDENGHVQVVCGAPNVREGLTVAWLPPGSTVPESIGKDPFVLEARALRGEISNGMLASPRELSLGDSHDGILEIDKDVAPGTDFASVYKLDDYIIDIENKMFTHRPDCFGILGVAREIAGIQHQKFTSPDWYRVDPPLEEVAAETLPLTVSNELPELVPRFTAITMSDVQVKPSPMWLQVMLAKFGQKSINNIVDLTNFYMLVTGQPLHAYDYDKVASGKLGVRMTQRGDGITLLNGKKFAWPLNPNNPSEKEVSYPDIVITDGEKPIGFGGVMGGAATEVDENTRNIILECATFDMYAIRRTSMRNGLFTDAVTRFNKGQSPLQNRTVLAKIVADIQHLANGKIASKLIDINHLPAEVMERTSLHAPVEVSLDFINARLGSKLSADEVKTLLENVEFKVEEQGEALKIIAPFWRTDIELPEDIVEEVGRLYGFDKLPLELPVRDITPAQKNPMLELKREIRDALVKAGANEVLTYSFVHGNLLDKTGQNRDQAFQLSNALSPDLQYFRLSLMPSLLDKVHANIKAGHDQFALFEFGKAHNLMYADDDNGLPMEFDMLDLVFAAKDHGPQSGAAYYTARKYVEAVADTLGVEVEFIPLADEPDFPVMKPFDHTRTAFVKVKGSDAIIGNVGEFKQSVRKNLKLPQFCAGFSLGLGALRQVAQQSVKYTPLSRFPSVEQDICLKVSADLPYAELANFVYSHLAENTQGNVHWMLDPLDIYQREDDQAHKQITFRFKIADYDKTLRDAEVAKMLDGVATAAKETFQAERV